jgi:Na+-translocating ferredoxin:NAD+ oxidoreductase subunit B
MVVLFSAIILGSLGFVFGIILVCASKKFSVKSNPKIEEISTMLPDVNCGACGYTGCMGYAESIVNNKAKLDKCTLAEESVINKIAEITNNKAVEVIKKVALVKCQGNNINCKNQNHYVGVIDCKAAYFSLGSFKYKACVHACFGFGTCVDVCPVTAISIKKELAVIDYGLCTGCGLCVKTCPKNLIDLVPKDQTPHVRCSSNDKGKDTKKACETGCIGCGLCAKFCSVGAIEIKDNLASINYDLCTKCGLCNQKCPTNAISNIKN